MFMSVVRNLQTQDFENQILALQQRGENFDNYKIEIDKSDQVTLEKMTKFEKFKRLFSRASFDAVQSQNIDLLREFYKAELESNQLHNYSKIFKVFAQSILREPETKKKWQKLLKDFRLRTNIQRQELLALQKQNLLACNVEILTRKDVSKIACKMASLLNPKQPVEIQQGDKILSDLRKTLENFNSFVRYKEDNLPQNKQVREFYLQQRTLHFRTLKNDFIKARHFLSFIRIRNPREEISLDYFSTLAQKLNTLENNKAALGVENQAELNKLKLQFFKKYQKLIFARLDSVIKIKEKLSFQDFIQQEINISKLLDNAACSQELQNKILSNPEFRKKRQEFLSIFHSKWRVGLQEQISIEPEIFAQGRKVDEKFTKAIETISEPLKGRVNFWLQTLKNPQAILQTLNRVDLTQVTLNGQPVGEPEKAPNDPSALALSRMAQLADLLNEQIKTQRPNLDDEKLTSAVSDLMTLMAVEYNPTFFLNQSGANTLANLFDTGEAPYIKQQQKEKYSFQVGPDSASLITEEQFAKYPNSDRKFHEGEFFKVESSVTRKFDGLLLGTLKISPGDVTLQDWVEQEKEIPTKKYIKISADNKFSYTLDKREKSNLLEVFEKINKTVAAPKTEITPETLKLLREKGQNLVDRALGTNKFMRMIYRLSHKTSQLEKLNIELRASINKKLQTIYTDEALKVFIQDQASPEKFIQNFDTLNGREMDGSTSIPNLTPDRTFIEVKVGDKIYYLGHGSTSDWKCFIYDQSNKSLIELTRPYIEPIINLYWSQEVMQKR